MTFEREGYRHSAWIIRLGERSTTIEADTNRSFRELDSFYVPRVPNPKQWDDYSNELVPNAEAKLLGMLALEPFTEQERHTSSASPATTSSASTGHWKRASYRSSTPATSRARALPTTHLTWYGASLIRVGGRIKTFEPLDFLSFVFYYLVK